MLQYQKEDVHMYNETIVTADEHENIQNDCGCDFNIAGNWPTLHNHTFFEVTYIFSKTLHHINGQDIWLEDNTLLITRPQDVHCFTDCHETIGQLNFKISCSYFRTLLDFFEKDFYDTVMNADDSMRCIQMTSAYGRSVTDFLEKLFMQPSLSKKYVSCKFMLTKFVKIFYNHFYVENNVSQPDIVKNTIKILQNSQNFTSNITDLLSNMGYSYMHIYRLFKEAAGQSPNTFFTEQKLHYAANLLLYTDYRIVEIANQAGFSSQARFDTSFKKFYGVTPKEYRRQGLSTND